MLFARRQHNFEKQFWNVLLIFILDDGKSKVSSWVHLIYFVAWCVFKMRNNLTYDWKERRQRIKKIKNLSLASLLRGLMSLINRPSSKIDEPIILRSYFQENIFGDTFVW